MAAKTSAPRRLFRFWKGAIANAPKSLATEAIGTGVKSAIRYGWPFVVAGMLGLLGIRAADRESGQKELRMILDGFTMANKPAKGLLRCTGCKSEQEFEDGRIEHVMRYDAVLGQTLCRFSVLDPLFRRLGKLCAIGGGPPQPIFVPSRTERRISLRICLE